MIAPAPQGKLREGSLRLSSDQGRGVHAVYALQQVWQVWIGANRFTHDWPARNVNFFLIGS